MISTGSHTVVETETKIVEQGVGIMIGELAMLKPETEVRALSGMAKTDCVFLLFNFDVFDLLVKVKFIILICFRKN